MEVVVSGGGVGGVESGVVGVGVGGVGWGVGGCWVGGWASGGAASAGVRPLCQIVLFWSLLLVVTDVTASDKTPSALARGVFPAAAAAC